MSNYPGQIDNSSSLPPATGDDAVSVNAVISATENIEIELGLVPSGPYSTVRTRLDILEARINNPFAPGPNVNNPFYIGGSPISGVSIQAGIGDPIITKPTAIPGSLYLREDGTVDQSLYSFRPDGYWHDITNLFTISGDLSGNEFLQTVIGIQGNHVKAIVPPDGYVLTWVAGTNQWEPKAIVSGSVTLSGDVTGPANSNRVVNINGASVPIAGSLTIGNSLYVNGSSSLSYNALNLSGGSSYVMGVLPATNQESQTLTGNVTGTTAANTVISLTGTAGAVNIASTGNVITWNNATTAPGIKQADNTTNSATAANLTIQAQNATGTTTVGGNLILKSGSGTSTNGLLQLQSAGTTIGQFNQTATDFIAFGVLPAQSGFIRVPSVATTAIVARNSINTADNTVLFLASNSNGVDSTLTGNQYASIGSITPGGASHSYFLSYTLQAFNVIGSTTSFTNQGYSSTSPSSLNTPSTGTATVTIVGSNATDTGTGAIIFGSSLSATWIQTCALSSTSAGSGTTGTILTIQGQAGQAATGASNNGGNGGNLVLSSGAGGTSGSASPGTSGSVQIQAGGSTKFTVSSSNITIGAFSTAGLVHNDSSGNLLSSTLVNADVSATAAIAVSKLAAGTSAQILLNNSTPTATWATVSNDATISNAGAVTVTGIQNNHIQSGTPVDGYVLTWSSSNNQWQPEEHDGNPIRINSDYHVNKTDSDIFADVSGNILTITLPSSPNFGEKHYIKDFTGNAATHNITVNGNGINIEQFVGGVAANLTIVSNYTSILLAFNGTNWSIF